MPSRILKLTERKLASPPKFVPHNVCYETIMGSVAYGVSSDSSDLDLYGFCIPPKDWVFPHMRGEILGFGKQINRFAQYQQHHIMDKDARAGKGQEVDVVIYNIVKYFQLCMDNNPNMIDSLFTPSNCVTFSNKIGDMVRDRRKIFLHKGSWHKFKGYAYSQMKKIKSKGNTEGKRKTIIEEHGYDVKFAYHVVRLLDEVEQILETGDIDLQRNREQLKAIRRGEWEEKQIEEYFVGKEKQLGDLYLKSSLPYKPEESKIKALLLECLEEHYGDISSCIVQADSAVQALREINCIMEKNRNIL